MRLPRWLSWRWPFFVTGTRYRRERFLAQMKIRGLVAEVAALIETVADLRARLAEAERKVKNAEAWAAGPEARYRWDEVMGSVFGESKYRSLAERILRRVEGRGEVAVAFCSAPRVTFSILDDNPVGRTHRVEHVKMVRFAIEIGMSPECPPEVAASQLTRQITRGLEQEVIKHWASQSAMLTVDPT